MPDSYYRYRTGNKSIQSCANIGYDVQDTIGFSELPENLGTITRVGEIIQAGHLLVGKSVCRVDALLKRVNGVPNGTLYARVYQGLNLVATIGQVNPNTIPNNPPTLITFSGMGSWIVQANDRICIEEVGVAVSTINTYSTTPSTVANASSTYFQSGAWNDSLVAYDVSMVIYYT